MKKADFEDVNQIRLIHIHYAPFFQLIFKHTQLVKIALNQSIGNIENAMWGFNCLGRLGRFGQYRFFLQTDSNFSSKGQFFVSILNKIPKLEKVGVTPFKIKKACWFLKMIKKTHGFKS